jgi:hypothetical protein
VVNLVIEDCCKRMRVQPRRWENVRAPLAFEKQREPQWYAGPVRRIEWFYAALVTFSFSDHGYI